MKNININHLFWNNTFKNAVANPYFSRSNIIQIYWYRFLGGRRELITIIGKVNSFTKRGTYLEETVVCLKKKIFGVWLSQYFPMSSPVVVALRVLY